MAQEQLQGGKKSLLSRLSTLEESVKSNFDKIFEELGIARIEKQDTVDQFLQTARYNIAVVDL